MKKDILNNAINLKNADETRRLEMKMSNLEHIGASVNSNKKDLIYEEENRLAGEIYKSVEKEKTE